MNDNHIQICLAWAKDVYSIDLDKQAKFLEQNFHCSSSTILHCRAKQASQNLAQRLFSLSVYLDIAETVDFQNVT